MTRRCERCGNRRAVAVVVGLARCWACIGPEDREELQRSRDGRPPTRVNRAPRAGFRDVSEARRGGKHV